MSINFNDLGQKWQKRNERNKKYINGIPKMTLLVVIQYIYVCLFSIKIIKFPDSLK